MTAPLPTVSDWKAIERNTLRGFFTAHLPSGMTLFENTLHYRDGHWWVMPASKPMLSKDGTALRDDAGKIRYAPIVSFESKLARDRFNTAVLTALRLAHPRAFAEAEAIAHERAGRTIARQAAKLLGMLGSDHAGERDAAGLAAHRLRQQAGITWSALLAPPPVKREPLFSTWRATCTLRVLAPARQQHEHAK